MGLGWEEQLF